MRRLSTILLASLLSLGAAAQTAVKPTTLWGNVISMDTWNDDYAPVGIYSFNASAAPAMKPLATNDVIMANAGSALYDGVFHFVHTKSTQYYLDIFYYEFDAHTWTQIGAPINLGEDGRLVALETAVDKNDGTVWGEFYNESMSGFEIGTIDYSQHRRTSTLCSTGRYYVALGITSDKTLYGIASDGNLYRISTRDGSTTRVGPTGLTLVNGPTDYPYNQSGEIDQRTNTFYWNGIDKDKRSALYEVNLQTGEAKKIADFKNGEQIIGMMIPDPEPAAGAPAKVGHLSITFDGAQPTAKVAFTMPSRTFDGAALTGDISYYVSANGDTIATGSAQAGAAVTTEGRAPLGQVQFVVTAANSLGSSELTRYKCWVGHDIPAAVDSVSMASNLFTRTVSLSWTAPVRGLHDGYLGRLSYDVFRYPDSVKVADGIAETHFRERLPEKEAEAYQYGVVVRNGDKRSAETRSDYAVLGKPVEVPFESNYADTATKDNSNLFTIVDANGDGKTWQFKEDYRGNYFQSQYSIHQATDDWLISPPIHLEGGKVYRLTVNAADDYARYPVTIETAVGRSPKATAMQTKLLPPTKLDFQASVDKETQKQSGRDFSAEYLSPADGIYYFGVHDLTEANTEKVNVFSLSVTLAANAEAPDTVAAFTVSPDTMGLQRATVAFRLPRQTIGKTALDAITRVDLLRNDSLIHSFQAPAPGDTITYVDNDVRRNGINTYGLIVVGKGGSGLTVEREAYVGVDIPQYPANGIITDTGKGLRLTWDTVATTGLRGHHVIPEGVTYKIYDDQGRLLGSTKATHYDIVMPVDSGEQELRQYILAASNVAGESHHVYTNAIVVGEAQRLPYFESFPEGTTDNFWYRERRGRASWNYTNLISANDDNGAIAYTAYNPGDEGWFRSGKISLQGTDYPNIVFSRYGTPGALERLLVEVKAPDGSEETIADFDYSQLEGEARWEQEMLEIPAKFTSERYVTVSFHAISSEQSKPVSVDNVSLVDLKTRDLHVSLQAPEKINKGEEGTVRVRVRNIGEASARNYGVRVTVDDAVVGDTIVRSSLTSFTERDMTFRFPTSIFDTASTARVVATIDYARDEAKENNSAEATVRLITSAETPVDAARLSGDDAAGYRVEWTAPAVTEERVSDDFESYEPWSIDGIGQWTVVDGDGYTTGGFTDARFPNQGEPFAFIVFNPAAMGIDINDATWITPHSGQQFMATTWQYNGEEYPDADNWLISPRLSGEAQTVTFWVRNIVSDVVYPERYEVLGSTAGTDTAAFSQTLRPMTLKRDGEWEQVSVSVPEGVRYFAIHQTSSTTDGDPFYFMVDDAEFTVGSGRPASYRVYRDGKLLATMPATASGCDVGKESGHSYGVTVVYSNGQESAPVEAKPTTGISLPSGESPADAYYSVDGLRLPAPQKGITIVRHADGRTTKVVRR